jgi:hypothetical protein
MVPSFELEATNTPSGEKTTSVTSSECPSRVWSGATSIRLPTLIATGISVGMGAVVGEIVGISVGIGRGIVGTAVATKVLVSELCGRLPPIPMGLTQEAISNVVAHNSVLQELIIHFFIFRNPRSIIFQSLVGWEQPSNIYQESSFGESLHHSYS